VVDHGRWCGTTIRRSDAVRAVAVGEDPGDLTTAENPEALEDIRAALASRAAP